MINSLKEVKTINGKKVMTNEDRPKFSNGEVDWDAFDEVREDYPICIDHDKDMISFKMLTKPASEGGNLANAQWSDLVATGLEQLKYFNSKYPCTENKLTIQYLESALETNELRTKNRQSRGVEGQNKL